MDGMTAIQCSDFGACLERVMQLEINEAINEIDRVSNEHVVSGGGTLEEYQMIAKAYSELREFNRAITWYKKGGHRL